LRYNIVADEPREEMKEPAKPTSVQIGPQTFRIEFRSTNEDGMLNDGSQGYTLDQSNLIVISAEIAYGKQKVTLMHEILHAARMVFENGLPEKDSDYEKWEHYFIGIYENAMLMIIKDNPKLIEWFKN
jgi:hypothetical protein